MADDKVDDKGDDKGDVAILFADICDSTPLYETSGDARALAVIARRLDELATLAGRAGGQVIRSKGDDVLCTFDQPGAALSAAAAMIATHDQDPAAVRVGLHLGRVIHARSDIFGDAVNVAARMLSLAKPGEVVASEELVDALPLAARQRMSPLGRCEIKGKQAPMSVYAMALYSGEPTYLARPRTSGVTEPMTVLPGLAVALELHGRTRLVEDGERLLLGRAERCDLVFDERCVSREHAWIKVRRGRATLTDQSSTGTWIVDRNGAHTTVRRESVQLHGSGTIRLGRHPHEPEAAPEIPFRIQRES